jgi:hypothetical protein
VKKNTLFQSLLLTLVCLVAAIGLYNYPLSKHLKMEDESAESEMLEAYYQQEFEKTVDTRLGYVPVERLKTAYDQLKRQASSRAAVGLAWTERGPSNIAGRTRTLLFDKNDATNKKVWAGSVGGGLWSTPDITVATPIWTSAGDFLNNLAITTIAQDAATPQYIYCGTGEGRNNTDAIRGLGIYISSNGGTSWTLLAATNNSNFYYVQKIVVDATGQVYAATNAGVYKSSNQGTTWTRVLGTATAPATATNSISDIEIGADGSIYVGTGSSTAATGQIWCSRYTAYTTATGNVGNWANISPIGAYRRVEIATAPNNSDVLYAMARNNTDNNCSTIFSCTNAVDATPTWTSNTAPTIYDQGNNSNFTRGQAWYDLIIAVDPNDATKVYIGGVDVLRSSNSGSTWEQITTWSSYNGGTAPTPWPRASVHADIHEIRFLSGSSTTALIGCDGGIFYSTNINGTLARVGSVSTPTFTSKNQGYNVTQYYAADNDPTACSNVLLAGAQDNGSQRLTSAGISTGTSVSGGDGMFCHIDQTNSGVQITSYVYNNYYYTTNSWTSNISHSVDNNGRFINPTEFDDTNNILYACEGAGSYLSIAGGILNGSGTTTPTVVTHSALTGFTGTPSAFKVDPNDANTLWVGMGEGNIRKVVNPHTATPTVTAIATAFGGYITSIDVQKGNANHILVTVSNYGATHIWESTNGTTFSTIVGNLPDMPVRWGIFNPLNADQIFLATELGVWSTDDINGASTVWAADNTGLANVRVDMLKYRESDYTIVAATHGRGVYTSKLSTPTPQTNGNVVAEQQAQSAQNALGANQTAYFYSNTDGQLICKITNNTAFNYGCTSVSVTRASNVSQTPVHFYSIINANDILPKTLSITPTTNTATGNYTITMYFTPAEITAWQTHTGATWAQSRIINCSGNITLVTPTATTAGGTVTILPNTGNTTTGLPFVSATFSNVTLGSYGVGGPNSTVLPIELVRFEGHSVDKSVVLNWETANEKNAKQFDIERSTDGKHFEKIGQLKAKGNNSTTSVNYDFTDYKPWKGINYYRLRQIDVDDVAVLSKVIAIEQTITQKLQVFPNPAKDKLTVISDLASNYTISDLAGREILRGYLRDYQNDIDVTTLPSGVYLVRTQAATVKFFKL